MEVPRHRTPGRSHGRRSRYLALTASLAVVAGVLGAGVFAGSWLLRGGNGRAAQTAAQVSRTAGAACSAGPGSTCASASRSPGGGAAPARQLHPRAPTPTSSARPSPRPVASAPTTAEPSSAAPSPAAPGAASADASAAASVLALINQARAQA